MNNEKDNLPAAGVSWSPCKIITADRFDQIVVKYLGGGREGMTTEEAEILLLSLYEESNRNGGIASHGTAIMDRRLIEQRRRLERGGRVNAED